MTIAVRVLGAAAILLAVGACSEQAGGIGECSLCHSGPEGGDSIFRGLEGISDPSDPAVGGHTWHLYRAEITGPFGCEFCHPIPEAIDSEDHFLGGNAKIVFSDFVSAGELKPRWDSQTRTCSQVYCHGAGPLGEEEDPHVTASWNSMTGTAPLCEGCHGLPPSTTRAGAPHPPGRACEACHPNANSALEITVPSLHINGIVEVDTEQ